MDLDTMISDLEELVSCESYSTDYAALAQSADVMAAFGRRTLGTAPETVLIDDVPHLRWSFGRPRVLLLGHHDTVWPIGSLRDLPWSYVDGVARGPGVFDMKAGLVQMFHALSALPSLDGVSILIVGDEERGSPTSRPLIEEAARGLEATFVLEASADGGALKTTRKGISRYEVVVHGKAAHAGLEPEKGVNAGVELAHQILAITNIARQIDSSPKAGAVSVTPTILSAGTSTNTIPASGRVAVDVRVPSVEAQQRVDTLMRSLAPVTPGAKVELRGGPNRPPLDPASSRGLYALAQRIARDLGMEPLQEASVGGASDGCFTAGVGCPTLDGLGAVGGGAHGTDEHVFVAEMPVRGRLLAGLVAAVLDSGREGGDGGGESPGDR
ncbi:M20 family metallopeptidase [Streptosporangiaceae bacterium NEAU-GS5]|nr:M20 family metallopeptidase [Streptosporangiaceae bacterium NEAU-GS5]